MASLVWIGGISDRRQPDVVGSAVIVNQVGNWQTSKNIILRTSDWCHCTSNRSGSADDISPLIHGADNGVFSDLFLVNRRHSNGHIEAIVPERTSSIVDIVSFFDEQADTKAAKGSRGETYQHSAEIVHIGCQGFLPLWRFGGCHCLNVWADIFVPIVFLGRPNPGNHLHRAVLFWSHVFLGTSLVGRSDGGFDGLLCYCGVGASLL